MKFSVCLPTGFEGLMHPIPFAEPEAADTVSEVAEQIEWFAKLVKPQV